MTKRGNNCNHQNSTTNLQWWMIITNFSHSLWVASRNLRPIKNIIQHQHHYCNKLIIIVKLHDNQQVSFQPAQKGKYLQRAPTSYQFVGSNDNICNDAATWTVICEDLTDRAWRNEWEVKYCKVKPEMKEKFRCLGLRILANRGDGWTTLRNIRMWERIESIDDVKDELWTNLGN